MTWCSLLAMTGRPRAGVWIRNWGIKKIKKNPIYMWNTAMTVVAGESRMDLSPKDVKNRKFRQGLTGYDTKEVSLFLKDVAQELERISMQNVHLSEANKGLDKRLAELRVKISLSSHKGAGNAREAGSQDRQDAILREARLKADEIVQQAEHKAAESLASQEEEAKRKAREAAKRELQIERERILSEAKAAAEKILAEAREQAEGQGADIDDFHHRAENIIVAAREEAESYKARLKQQINKKAEKERERILADANAEATCLLERARANTQERVEDERREAARKIKKADEMLVEAKIKAREILDAAQLEAEQSAARVREEAERHSKALIEEAQARARKIVEQARTETEKSRKQAAADVATPDDKGQAKLIHKLMKKVKADSYTDDYQRESGDLVISRMEAVLASDAEQEARSLLRQVQAETERLKAEHEGKLEETKKQCDNLLQEARREAHRITAAAKQEADAVREEIGKLNHLRCAPEEDARTASSTAHGGQRAETF